MNVDAARGEFFADLAGGRQRADDVTKSRIFETT